MSDIKEQWHQYVEWLKRTVPNQYALLNPPANHEDFVKFADITGVLLPEDMMALYSVNNGGKPYNQIVSLEFLSLEDVTRAWQEWRDVGYDNDDEKTDGSYPDGAIKQMGANPKWIPILADGGGNNVGVDLDPGINGSVGQIINFGPDEEHKFVMANTLHDFIRLVMSYIEEGKYIVEDNGDAEKARYYLDDGTTRRGHLTDFLREAIVPANFVYKSAPTVIYGNTASYTEYTKDGSTARAFSVSFQMNQGKLTINCPDQELKKYIKGLAKTLDPNTDETQFLAALHAALPESYGDLVRTSTGFSGSAF